MRCAGEPTYINETTFTTLNDGSKSTVKCIIPSGVVANWNWAFVGVTGISSCEMVSGELRRVLLITKQDDITPYRIIY